MRFNYTKLIYGALSSTLLLLASCGGGSASLLVGFPQPAGTVAVNFTVDDTANMVYQAGELQWKGSFAYDSTTRMVIFDGTFGNVPLYDDGPWTAGGHEPAGAVAGDHKWGVTVFVAPDVSPLNFQYGFVDQSAADAWLWVGANGTFSVAPGATAAITAAGQILPLFGTTDMKLVLDTTALGGGPWSFATVKVSGTPWYWGLITLVDDGTNGDDTPGDGKYTFVLSQYVGAGKTYPHFGLLNSGDIPAFVYELNGVEYKDISSNAYSTGVTAFVKASGAISWTPVAVAVNPNPTSHNTYITVP